MGRGSRHPMLQRWVRVAQVLATVLAILGNGAAVGGLDALLYHTSGLEAQPVQIHFERLGGSGEHDDRCLLTSSATEPHSRLVVAVSERFAPAVIEPVPLAPPIVPPQQHPLLDHPSRAPPTLLV